MTGPTGVGAEPAGLLGPPGVVDAVRAGRAAVLVVDLQNDFCHPAGAMATRGADVAVNSALVTPVDRFVRVARAAGARVVMVALSREPHDTGSPLPGMSAGVCAAGSWGAALHDGLFVAPGDLVLRKSRYSAFLRTGLDGILRGWGVHTLLVVGTTANVCVDSTVRDAAQRDFRVVVLADLVGHVRAELAGPALRNLGLYFAEVCDSAALLDALRAVTG